MNFHTHLLGQSTFLKLHLFLLFTILIVCINPILSQDSTTKVYKSIRPSGKYSGSAWDKIEFWDSTSNSLIKALDLTLLSPYTRLPEKQVDATKTGVPIYRFAVKDMRKRNKKALYHPDSIPDLIDSLYVTSQIKLSRTSQEFICVSYEIMTSYKGIYRNILSTHSTLVIYNKRGEEMNRIENIKADPYNIQITDSGDYVFFRTGDEGSNKCS